MRLVWTHCSAICVLRSLDLRDNLIANEDLGLRSSLLRLPLEHHYLTSISLGGTTLCPVSLTTPALEVHFVYNVRHTIVIRHTLCFVLNMLQGMRSPTPSSWTACAK
jgi:hypothetical protein